MLFKEKKVCVIVYIHLQFMQEYLCSNHELLATEGWEDSQTLKSVPKLNKLMVNNTFFFL